ncbi:MAG: FeoB-associated Cys-rich membrane protein [Ruminococcus sp.]|nr:FeoB-associated Cys-rich membrane protein [Ruminococcus sp.]
MINIWDVVITAFLVYIIGRAAAGIIKNKKSCGCSGDCGSCTGCRVKK